jgi:hypothetical protein
MNGPERAAQRCPICSVPVPVERGPDARYCSKACRRAGEMELRRLQNELQILEGWKTSLLIYRHMLTAFTFEHDMQTYETRTAECKARLLALLRAIEGETLPDAPADAENAS